MSPKIPRLPSIDMTSVKDTITSVRNDIESDYAQLNENLDIVNTVIPPPPTPDSTEETEEVTDEETMLYQVKKVHYFVEQLEEHLSEGCRIGPKRCDCCLKHGEKVEGFATETIPIFARSGEDPEIFAEIAEWAQRVQEIPLSSKDEVYRQESGQASRYSKQLRAMKSKLKASLGISDEDEEE